jgi:hypothetical protein
MGFNSVDNFEQANLFLDCFNENFLFQNITKNTFQHNVNETINVLDYVIADSACRIFSVNHQPPLGNIEHGHHVIHLNFSYLNANNRSIDFGKKLLYQKGKYDQFEDFLNETNWLN